MEAKNLEQLLNSTANCQKENYDAVKVWQGRIVSRMVETAHQEEDKLEHHLLEMPLSVIIYQWVILRLKSRPWRLLVPASFILTLLFQGLLSRLNLLQLLTH